MKTNSSFPHPVLGINKGILPDLEVDNLTCTKSESSTSYEYHFNLKFNDSLILSYIKEGKAQYACEIDCRKTLFKRKFFSSTPEFTIKLNRFEVDGHIDFSFYVQTKYGMPAYSNPHFNPDYRDKTGKLPSFSLDKGDILVMFSSFSDNVKIDLNEKMSLSSFLKIKKGESDLKHVYLELDSDIIYVQLPEEQYQLFQHYNNTDTRGVLYSSIVLNSLTEAILHIQEYTDRDWAESITKRVENESVYKDFDVDDPKDAPKIAFTMLSNCSYGDPYDLLFKSLENIETIE